MEFTLCAQLNANITFTDRQWRLIIDAAKRHYDATIRMSVEVGGWLYGMNNRREFSNGETKDAELSFRQVDSLIKTLELYHTPDADEIKAELHRVIRILTSKDEEINKSLSGEKYS